jgi:hypothetical protein
MSYKLSSPILTITVMHFLSAYLQIFVCIFAQRWELSVSYSYLISFKIEYYSMLSHKGGDRVTTPSKLRIHFLYALRPLSEHHHNYLAFHFTFSQLILHFCSLFRIFGACFDLQSLFQKLQTYFGPPELISETLHL